MDELQGWQGAGMGMEIGFSTGGVIYLFSLSSSK